MTDQFKEAGNPPSSLATQESRRPLHGLYAQVYQIDVLERAFAEVVEHPSFFGADGADFDDVHSTGLKSFLAKLKSDLGGRTYQPSATLEGSSKFPPLRDLVVQAAMKIVLEPVFAAALPDGERAERAAWVARTIERGLTRVYVEHLETEGVREELLVAAVGRRVADAEFVTLFETMLRSSPGRRGFLASVAAQSAFEGIDAILEEAKAIGRHESLVHVSCARFGKELIVLVHADSQYDWVLPALKSRLVVARDKVNVGIDPRKTQVVDMAKGARLEFLGFEFRRSAVEGKTVHVAYRRLKTPAPPQFSWAARLGQWILAPLKNAAGAVGRLVPTWPRRTPRPTGELSPWHAAWKSLGTALASDWRMVPLLLYYLARAVMRFLGRRWELVMLVLCGVGAVVLFLDPFGARRKGQARRKGTQFIC